MENKSDKFNQKIVKLRKKLQEERKSIQKIDDLVKKKVERSPGLWEYDFDELESEIWERHKIIEKKIKELSRKISEGSGKSPKNVFDFFKNLRGNLIRQNVINQEIIPFYLSTLLVLQKIKDRLNSLEYKVNKIEREKEDLMEELEEYKAELVREKRKMEE